MTVVQINATCGVGSTGKICVAVSKLLTEQSVENYILYNAGESDYPLGWRYMTPKELRLQALFSRLRGNFGWNSKAATKRLIAKLEELAPDVVHLHNLHSHNCHLGELMAYFKRKQLKLYWTFHDCWMLTGYCTHFDGIGCQKWRDSCGNCPQKKQYSWFFDRSSRLLAEKQKLLEGLDLTIVTPSQWLADLVGQSYLKTYPIRVINNGIDLAVFKPTESDFRERYGLQESYVILGVAFGWNDAKGLDVFRTLASRLDERFRIVLVGTDADIEQTLPSNILPIRRTQNQQELAAIYTAADLFVNPTREENYPTVNMEAIACGTPVLTFDTGGSAEMIDASCGVAVPRGDVDAMEREIRRIFEQRPFSSDGFARAALFDEILRYKEYVALYEESADQCDRSGL